jgi:uncharacterized protein YndB with AHSA1/START domain
MAWQTEYTAESAASPAAVWRRWTDVEHWDAWAPEGVEWARLDGPFEPGTTGEIKAPGSPKGTFTLVGVEPERSFVTEAKLPGARMRFEYLVEPTDTGAHLTHRATIGGPLAFLWARIAGRRMEEGMPDSVRRLAVIAAHDESPA